MRSRWFGAVQTVLGIAIVALVAVDVAGNWDQVRSSGLRLAFRPGWIALSLGVTWVAFGGLIEGWRRVVVGWRQSLAWSAAARVWVLASFGKYLPGKVWSIAGMAVMSDRIGVSGRVAMAAAVVMQLLAIGTGVGLAAFAVGPMIEAARPGAGMAMMILGVVAMGGLLLVGSADALDLLWRLLRRDGPAPAPPRRMALVEGIAVNLLAWALYGVAFWALARGIVPEADLPLRVATGVFAASYLAGFLGPTPGGLGVRESLLIAMLQPVIGLAPAIAMSGASRLAFTVNEVGAALPFLLTRGPTRDVN